MLDQINNILGKIDNFVWGCTTYCIDPSGGNFSYHPPEGTSD